MAKLIAIMGESGSGKTTSLRNLPPEQTFFIDADMKGLAWKGWRQQYNAQNKNYLRTADQELVLKILRHVNEREEYKNINYVVIDTLNGIMVSDEFKRMKDKGYDKWVDLATAVWNIIEYAQNMRDEITVICVCHCQTERDDTGYAFTRIKTSGRKLEKISLETKFPVVLYARAKTDGTFVFETRANNSTAKTPLGAFANLEVPNDIVEVLKTLEEY